MRNQGIKKNANQSSKKSGNQDSNQDGTKDGIKSSNQGNNQNNRKNETKSNTKNSNQDSAKSNHQDSNQNSTKVSNQSGSQSSTKNKHSSKTADFMIPIYDTPFKYLFADKRNMKLTESLVKGFLGIDSKEKILVDVMNPNLPIDSDEDKQGIVDSHRKEMRTRPTGVAFP